MRDSKVASRFAVCALLLTILPGDGSAQNYPTRPIRFIVPFPPGAATDIVTRIIGQKMTESWGVPVLADNRPGATGMIGADIAAKSAPDGYTLVNVISSHVVHPSLNRKVPFDPIKDFTPIIMLMRSPNLICVNPSLPVRSIKELVALARANPGKLSFGSPGLGSSNHLTGEMIKAAAKIDIIHIPYKGGAPAAIDAIGGQIPILIQTVSSAGGYVKAGKLRALAVASIKRHPVFPNVPTLDESGFPGFATAEWWVVLGPAAVPKDIVAKLNAEIDRIMNLADVQAKIAEIGTDYIGGTPEQAGTYMRAEMEKWSKVVQAAGLRPE